MSVRTAVWRLREGHAWITNAALIAIGFALLMFCRQLPIEWEHFHIGFSGVSSASAVLYLAAVAVVLTQPTDRWTFRIVLGFAIAFQAMLYFEDPYSSSDIYRYVWDGIVQHAHINPYRYVPADRALAFLRAPNQDVYDGINRKDYARTIYPPVAQMVYWLVTFFSPTVAAMKMAMIGFLCVAGGALLALLKRLGRRREEILLFAWCPILAWETALTGHVDAAILAFVSLALLFRFQGKPGWTGFFLGLAVFTKFYPLVLFPALYTRRDWKMPAVVAAIGVAGYGIYSSAGKYVLGFAGGYEKEEGMRDGTRYFLLELVHRIPGLGSVPVKAYMVLCALVFCALTVWAWRRATTENVPLPWNRVGAPTFVRIATCFALALMLLFSPHYSWYVMWLIPFFTLDPTLVVATYLMGIFYLLTTALADGDPDHTFVLNAHLYSAVALAFALQWALQRWPVRQWFVSKLRADAEVHRPGEAR